MNKKYASRMIWMTLVGAAFCAFQLPALLYGKPPETIDGTIQPRFTSTAVPPEVLLTQQAFAIMFFTPTDPPEPTRQPFLAFLLPITGPTRTFTPTASNTPTATLSATPTRTLLPFFQTQTRASDGGGGGNIFTPTPLRTATPNVTLTVFSTLTLVPSATDEPPPTLSPTPDLPTNTPTPEPTDTPRDTNTPRPTNTHRPPPDTDTPEPPPTATDEPPPTATDVPPDTPEAPPNPGGNSSPDGPATSSRYLMQFIFMYVLGATFLGVVFRPR